MASYAIARAAPGTTAVQSRTAAMVALFAIGLWVLALIARPLDPARIALLAGMAAGLGLLFAFPLTRRIFSLQIPPLPILLAVLGIRRPRSAHSPSGRESRLTPRADGPAAEGRPAQPPTAVRDQSG